MKVKPRLRKNIKGLYQQVNAVVRLKGEESKEFSMMNGLKQGDSLSPLLFVILMDKVLKECKSKTKKTYSWILENATYFHPGSALRR